MVPASEFWIVVQMNEAATRCGLQGAYWLQVGTEALSLKDIKKKNIVREWPYKLLRRYGTDKVKNHNAQKTWIITQISAEWALFQDDSWLKALICSPHQSSLTIEAGRRCDSGPGSFIFETPQAERIFSMIQSNIKQKSSTISADNQNQEADKVSNIRAHSPLPKIPDLSSLAATLENKSRKQENKSAASEESTQAPITLMPLPLIPTQDSPTFGSVSSQSEAVYADPVDCIQATVKPQRDKALYVDPASVLPLQPPGSRSTLPPSTSDSLPSVNIDRPDSVYSEVYDKISPVQIKQSTPCPVDKEPIYTVPLSKTEEEELPKKESKPDPFAHLYAQVCKAKPSVSTSTSADSTTAPSAQAVTSSGDQPLDDIIYENLGII